MQSLEWVHLSLQACLRPRTPALCSSSIVADLYLVYAIQGAQQVEELMTRLSEDGLEKEEGNFSALCPAVVSSSQQGADH